MDNDHPKVDMVNILPDDTEKAAKAPVEEKNEEETGVETMIDDATMTAASAFASDELSPSVPLPGPLPGAYHVTPSPTAAAIATAATISARQGRVSSFDRTLINTYTEDHHDDSAAILVPTASVVQENELYAGRIVEAAPWEDSAGLLEARMDSSNNSLPKDAVWIGKKRAIIYLFAIFVVIAGLVTGLTTALIRSDRSEEEGLSASLSSFDNSETSSPSPFPPPSRPLQEQLMAYTPSPSPSLSSSEDDDQLDGDDYLSFSSEEDQLDGVDYQDDYKDDVDDSHDSGTTRGGSGSGGYGGKRT
jgi:hypothetical protein